MRHRCLRRGCGMWFDIDHRRVAFGDGQCPGHQFTESRTLERSAHHQSSGMRGFANTWFFNTVLTETAGVSVSLTSTVNFFDGAERPAIVSNIVINAHGTATLNRQFCFVAPTQHTVQATFTGTDANGHLVTVTTPIVTLTAKP